MFYSVEYLNVVLYVNVYEFQLLSYLNTPCMSSKSIAVYLHMHAVLLFIRKYVLLYLLFIL